MMPKPRRHECSDPKKSPAQMPGASHKKLPIASPRKEFITALVIFVAALAIRLIYLYESADNPTFTEPIIDSVTYHELARTLALEKRITSDLFWQPMLYPVFLASIYAMIGPSIIWAKVIQLVLGAFTCLLVYKTAKDIFDRRVGIIAGIITGFYGPLIFFEAELVAAGLTAFWAILLVWLFLRAARTTSLLLCLLLGLCGALATLTRSTFLLFVPAGSLWMVAVIWRSSRRRAVLALLMVIVGFVAITAPTAALCKRLTGRYSIMPFGGSLNLYIGNNPDQCRTLNIRPGWRWEQLIAMPAMHGVENDYWAKSEFFSRLIRQYALEQPVAFTRDLGRKAVSLVNSREIPRNLDIYLFRQWSALQRVLTWKSHGFGFPFGLLLPLSLIGLVYHARRFPAPVGIFLIFYPLSLVLMFVTSRYRVPIVPVMALPATAGCSALAGMAASHRWGRLALTLAGSLAVMLLATLPGPFCQEEPDYRAELYYCLAYHGEARGQLDQSIANYQKALEINPDFGDAHTYLAEALAETGRFTQAVKHFDRALELEPENPEAHNSYGKALAERGEIERAARHFTQAVLLNPENVEARHNLAVTLAQRGKWHQAIENWEKAIQIDDNPQFRYFLATVYEKVGRIDEAVEQYEKVLRRQSDFTPASQALARIRGKNKTAEPPK